MKSNLLVLAMVVFYGSVWGESGAPETIAARRAARRAYNVVLVKAKTDWKGWLAKNFPDESKSWPEDCSKAFELVLGDGKWDFVGKGNIDRDNAPTGLLLRVKNSPDHGYIIVVDLAIVKWIGGKWDTLLHLGADEGVALSGVKPGAMQSKNFHGYDVSFSAGHATNKNHPGMVISAAAVDQDGHVLTEDADFYYLPNLKKYSGEAN